MRKAISKALNLIIAVLVLWVWVSMTFRLGRIGALSAGGFQSLRYFTVLSNLLQGCVSLACLRGKSVGRWKYVSTVAIALTFFVVLLLLGPAYGYDTVYVGSNFWSHLVVPILAMADFLFFDRDGTYAFRDSLLALIPMLAYGLLYTVNLVINGVEDNDWYGFAKGGPKTAAAAFLIILGINWIVALALWLPRRRRARTADTATHSF